MSSDDEEGPRPISRPDESEKKRVRLAHAKETHLEGLLSQLPSSEMYEKSWMHRDFVTRIASLNKTDFVVTSSVDGFVKFWKHVKAKQVLEFVKTFAAHNGPVSTLAASPDSTRLVSLCAKEGTIRLFLVRTFDMVASMDMPNAGQCAFVSNSNFCVCDSTSPLIRIVDFDSLQVTKEFRPAAVPTTFVSFSSKYQCAVSCDASGVLSYWVGPECTTEEAYTFPNKTICTSIKLKLETDLFDLAKKKLKPTSLVFSSKNLFAVGAHDGSLRVFDFLSGKCVYETSFIDSPTVEDDVQYELDQKWLIGIKDSSSVPGVFPLLKCAFDESAQVLLVPKTTGIEMIDLETKKMVRAIGKIESTERFCELELFQGEIQRDYQMDLAMAKSLSEDQQQGNDSMLTCTSMEKDRFFVFTSREPEEQGRDVFNEKPSAAQIARAKAIERAKKASGLAKAVCLHTTMGDIKLNLFPYECPKTVENFLGHSKKGTYDGVIIHRVIRGFMIQTGDPHGDGTGGESIWGGTFEDEFSETLKHDRAFTVSMANCGANTNGSQFFITSAPTPHLDGKHTVFGRVEDESSQEVVKKIEAVKVDTRDRPVKDVKIASVTIE